MDIGNGGVFIAAVSGDDAVIEKAERLHAPTYTLEELYGLVDSGKARFDIAVSFLYGRILRGSLIRSARFGCINFHPAPLPDYKGRAGCSFAILDKLTEWGCTAHYMDEGIDTGNIISIKKFPMDWRAETAISLKNKTVSVLQEMYKEILFRAVRKGGLIESREQDSNCGRYISKADMLEAMEVKPGDDVDAKIRAFWFPPHKGAYTVVGGRRYMLINDFILEQISKRLAE